RGVDVGSIKHHSHAGFEIDYPGKDSYRHRAAGATETIIAAPGQMALMRTIPHNAEIECSELVKSMPNHDIVIVEGYRESGLPMIEVMRAANERDRAAADAFIACTDLPEVSVKDNPIANKTLGILTDMDDVKKAAQSRGIAVFDIDDVNAVVDFLQTRIIRPRLSVVIQAGGESKRMGQSKALVSFLGRPLICRMIERLAPIADELIITTNEADKLAFVHEMYPEHDIRLVPDVCEFRGSVPGLYTAFKSVSHRYVAVVACDMVFASPALIIDEAVTLKELDCDAVVPKNSHGYEPFHGVYRADRCLPVVEAKLAEGVRNVQGVLKALNMFELSGARVHDIAPMGGCFVNANTPEELAAYERIVAVD
ncbi:MAG: molybdopterin-guanine dinucleotide biosynthesis protein B, partial [Eggerthellaceae bacterium]|nr:molybdopterin-guanine dinucleotide biosynthesis protein B [Eggerthellaceae bacterium]